MSSNYYVQNNVIWMGVVENTKDPLKMGRVQVRIFGVHTDNLNLIPTEDLPWALSSHSTNNSKSFSSLLEGDHVIGYFPDGIASQAPIILGVIPGVMTKAWDTTKGFSPQSKDPVKTDKPDGLAEPGVDIPTIGAGARGDVANTKVGVTNNSLVHSCDFRYIINLGTLDVGLGSLINPVTAIQEAIRSGKNQAAQLMGLLLTQISTNLRTVINAILSTLGFDPSGQLSLAFSIAKDIFREINAITKKVAMVVETASLYYNLVKDITIIVDYLRSLPERILATVQGCIDQFLNSIDAFVNQLKQIPGMYEANITNMLDQLSSSTKTALNTANNTNVNNLANTTTDISNLVNITVYNTDAAHANLIMDFISTNYANAEVTLANATANSFNISTSQTP